MSKPTIFTIGHSTHPIEYFRELLVHYGVSCVVDVRSMPASRFNPQYNKKSLLVSLNQYGMDYIHLGDAFGARQIDPELLDHDGRVDFEKIRRSEKFKNGIQNLWSLTDKGHTVALMCSESEPIRCHRFSMISIALTDFEVRHILKDKSVVSQEKLEQDLLQIYRKKLPQPDFFRPAITDAEKLKAAYEMINREVGYVPSTPKADSKK